MLTWHGFYHKDKASSFCTLYYLLFVDFLCENQYAGSTFQDVRLNETSSWKKRTWQHLLKCMWGWRESWLNYNAYWDWWNLLVSTMFAFLAFPSMTTRTSWWGPFVRWPWPRSPWPFGTETKTFTLSTYFDPSRYLNSFLVNYSVSCRISFLPNYRSTWRYDKIDKTVHTRTDL